MYNSISMSPKPTALLWIALLLLYSCANTKNASVTTYYIYSSPEPVVIYETKQLSNIVGVVPAGENFVLYDYTKRKSKAKHKEKSGYIKSSPVYVYQNNTDSIDAIKWRGDSMFIANKYQPKLSSIYFKEPGQSGSESGKYNGPVHVRGYYRKDGTYVKPHTRSAPGTKKKN